MVPKAALLGPTSVILLLLSSFYAYSTFQTPPPLRRLAGVDLRIERLARYNQRLQHALAAATAISAQPSAVAVVDQTDDETSKHEQYAYVFYATSNAYACSVLVNIGRLRELQSSLAAHVLVSSDVSNAYVTAMQAMEASVHFHDPPQLAEGSAGYYKNCLLKLLAFKMHVIAPGVKRVLVLDADQLILKNMDQLFDRLPDVDVAAPRAYWLGKAVFASTFMMVNLSDRLWKIVEEALSKVEYNEFDMDLINDLLGDTVMILSGEYVTLNSHWEDWNLPKWYRPSGKINWKTVELVNKLSNARVGSVGRREDDSGEGSIVEQSSVVSDGSSELQDTSVAVPPESPLAAAEDTDLSGATQNDTVVARLPKPRFPLSHPITKELYSLYDTASVVHYTALGKPWTHSVASVALMRPDAHPLLADQIEKWRTSAQQVCPGGLSFGVA